MLPQKQIDAVLSEVTNLMRLERERQGMSMNALAEKAGLSQPMVSLVERGERNPTLETLLRMAYALRVDLAEVIAAATRKEKT